MRRAECGAQGPHFLASPLTRVDHMTESQPVKCKLKLLVTSGCHVNILQREPARPWCFPFCMPGMWTGWLEICIYLPIKGKETHTKEDTTESKKDLGCLRTLSGCYISFGQSLVKWKKNKSPCLMCCHFSFLGTFQFSGLITDKALYLRSLLNI